MALCDDFLVSLYRNKRLICRMHLIRPPAETQNSVNWIITEYADKINHQIEGLPQLSFKIASDESGKKRWETLIDFLRAGNKVALVYLSGLKIYILPDHVSEKPNVVYLTYPVLKINNKTIFSQGFVDAGPFTAISVLVDRASERAEKLKVQVKDHFFQNVGKKIPMLVLVDDGKGMSHSDITKMFEGSTGSGLSLMAAALKLGHDAMILTQTADSRSLVFFSKTLNEGREIMAIPVVTYRKQATFMEIDLKVQSPRSSYENLETIKRFSPFNEYFIGEQFGFLGEFEEGTRIYVWNLEKREDDNTRHFLEWPTGNIFLHSLESLPNIKKNSMHSSLKTYLGLMYRQPRMKLYVQGSLVKCLVSTEEWTGVVRHTYTSKDPEKPCHLILGCSKVESENKNCGIHLYWNGRLIEGYKKVGQMLDNENMGDVGLMGLMDLNALSTHLILEENVPKFVKSDDYRKLLQWIGAHCDRYYDDNFDPIPLDEAEDISSDGASSWIQCDSCRKWRRGHYSSDGLPWYCHMPPFKEGCGVPAEVESPGEVTVRVQRDSVLE